MAGEYRGRRVAVKLLTDPEGMPPDQLEPFLETFAREAEVLGRWAGRGGWRCVYVSMCTSGNGLDGWDCGARVSA